MLLMFLAFLAKTGLDHEKMFLVHGAARWGELRHDNSTIIVPAAIQVDEAHLEIAQTVWTAYCAPSPETWPTLLHEDVSVFPFLRQTIGNLLHDLPDIRTGLGEAEKFALTTIGADGKTFRDVMVAFHETPLRMLDMFQIEGLLNSLAGHPNPVITGLEGKPNGLSEYADPDRRKIYYGSQLKLSQLGRQIVEGKSDLVEEHGIDRWWGGTHLTSEACWRWDNENQRITDTRVG